jgi:asparagine synthetase B (glutamine-hydrolysing)
MIAGPNRARRTFAQNCFDEAFHSRTIMCGICGIAFAHGDPGSDPETVRRMTQIIRHRRPDDDGFNVKPGIKMGVRRLSIVDAGAPLLHAE